VFYTITTFGEYCYYPLVAFFMNVSLRLLLWGWGLVAFFYRGWCDLIGAGHFCTEYPFMYFKQATQTFTKKN
jgi:hypothetical protein